MFKSVYINQTRIKTEPGLSLNVWVMEGIWIFAVKLTRIFELSQIKINLNLIYTAWTRLISMDQVRWRHLVVRILIKFEDSFTNTFVLDFETWQVILNKHDKRLLRKVNASLKKWLVGDLKMKDFY